MTRSVGVFARTFRLFRAPVRAVAVTVAMLVAGQEALAQSAVCRQIESELAGIGRGGGNPRLAQQARARLGAIQDRMAQLGCNRGGFLFGPQPPAECGSLRAQYNAAANQHAAATQQSGGSSARRAQLMAALDANNCRGDRRQRQDLAVTQSAPQPPRQRGFFEMLFGGGQSQPAYATETVPQAAEPDPNAKKPDDKRKVTLGGNMPICVRTCDGYFFPVNYQGADDDNYEEVCRASCPNATTELYWMRAGADLDTAVAPGGKAYSSMPAAFRYRQAYDPTCTCKKPDESWAMALREADQLVRDRRSDITVTKERSDEMARPLPPRELRGVRNKQAATKAPDPEMRAPIADIDGNGRLDSQAGETREVTSPGGATRNIRVLTPNISID